MDALLLWSQVESEEQVCGEVRMCDGNVLAWSWGLKELPVFRRS